MQDPHGNPKNEAEMSELLEYRTTDVRALDRAIGVKAWHWSLSGIVPEGQRRECEVGKRVQLVCRIGPMTHAWGLLVPDGSKTVVSGGAFVPDKPGAYTAMLTIGGFARTVSFFAAPPELYAKIGPPDGVNNPWLVLRGRLNDGAAEAARRAQEVEPEPHERQAFAHTDTVRVLVSIDIHKALVSGNWGRLASPA